MDLTWARPAIAALALAWAAAAPARGQDFREFSSKGLPRSEGVVVRVNHPSGWKKVVADDEMALAEFRGVQGKITGVLQIGRGGRRADMEAACQPQRAPTMLQALGSGESDTRITDVFARKHQGRPAFELRYERNKPPTFTVVRSVIVCLKDSKLLVSCGGEGRQKAAVRDIEPVCRQVLDSLAITEE
jgi:hypothetical protein